MKYKNNPLNIRYNKFNDWKGQLAPINGFCQFESIYYGFRAAVLLLNSYRRIGLFTPYEIVSRWSPSFENPTESYIKFVCENGGFSSSSEINSCSDYVHLLNAMARFEQGRSLSIDEFEQLRLAVYENHV